jgi:hypothetical protein
MDTASPHSQLHYPLAPLIKEQEQSARRKHLDHADTAGGTTS